jgi:hypothetical protein
MMCKACAIDSEWTLGKKIDVRPPCARACARLSLPPSLLHILFKKPSSKDCRFRLHSFWNSLFRFTFISPAFLCFPPDLRGVQRQRSVCQTQEKGEIPLLSPSYCFHLPKSTNQPSFPFAPVLFSRPSSPTCTGCCCLQSCCRRGKRRRRQRQQRLDSAPPSPPHYIFSAHLCLRTGRACTSFCVCRVHVVAWCRKWRRGIR